MLAEVKEPKSLGDAMDGVPESLTREGWIRLGGNPWGRTVNMRKYMITEGHLVSYYSVRSTSFHSFFSIIRLPSSVVPRNAAVQPRPLPPRLWHSTIQTCSAVSHCAGPLHVQQPFRNSPREL